LFTRIIRAIVSPRKKSRDSNRPLPELLVKSWCFVETLPGLGVACKSGWMGFIGFLFSWDGKCCHDVTL
jgi:hypothetical protein